MQQFFDGGETDSWIVLEEYGAIRKSFPTALKRFWKRNLAARFSLCRYAPLSSKTRFKSISYTSLGKLRHWSQVLADILINYDHCYKKEEPTCSRFQNLGEIFSCWYVYLWWSSSLDNNFGELKWRRSKLTVSTTIHHFYHSYLLYSNLFFVKFLKFSFVSSYCSPDVLATRLADGGPQAWRVKTRLN